MELCKKERISSKLTLIEQVKSSNGKVFLYNTVILFNVHIQGLYEQLLMHNYRRGTEVVLLDGEGTDV